MLNVDKTETIIFKTPRNLSKHQENLAMNFN